MEWPFNPNFPKVISLVELADDNGLRHILRQYKEFLPAADKWAEQDYDYQERHEDPKRLPVTDPWSYLLKLRDVPEAHKAIFRAAQSQLPALRHLIRMAEGIASLDTDWYQEAIEARAGGEKRKYHKAMSKVAAKRAFSPEVQKDVRTQNNQELLKSMEHVQKHWKKHRIKHGEKDEINQPKTWPELWAEFRRNNGRLVLLVEWWVHCGVNDVPGLMFWRNDAMAKFLNAHVDQSNLTSAAIKKDRQRLGLIPVGDKKHFVWDCTFSKDNDGSRKIKGFLRDGRQSFCAGISSTKKISAAVMTAFNSP